MILDFPNLEPPSVWYFCIAAQAQENERLQWHVTLMVMPHWGLSSEQLTQRSKVLFILGSAGERTVECHPPRYLVGGKIWWAHQDRRRIINSQPHLSTKAAKRRWGEKPRNSGDMNWEVSKVWGLIHCKLRPLKMVFLLFSVHTLWTSACFTNILLTWLVFTHTCPGPSQFLSKEQWVACLSADFPGNQWVNLAFPPRVKPAAMPRPLFTASGRVFLQDLASDL